MFNFFKFLLKNGFKNIVRNMTLSVFTVITIMLTLTLLGIMLVLVDGLNQIMDNVMNSQKLEIFFADTAGDERIDVLLQDIEAYDGVTETVFIDKKAALERFRDMLGDDDRIVDGYTDEKNPFPASSQVTLDEASKVIEMAAWAKDQRGVKEVNYSQQLTEWMSNTGGRLYLSGSIAIFVIGLVAAILIGSSIRVSIYSRRDEIGMMKLIGATNSYIQGPFLMEGLILSIIGLLIACITVTTLARVVLGSLPQNLSFVKLGHYYSYMPGRINGMVWTICTLAGIAIGGLASVVSTRRYIRI